MTDRTVEEIAGDAAETAAPDAATSATAVADSVGATDVAETAGAVGTVVSTGTWPLTDVIEDQTRQALTTGPGGGLVPDFRINWVWLPPWGPDKITDDGRDQLRSLGFNV